MRRSAEVVVDLLAPCFAYEARRIGIDEVGTQPGEKLYKEFASHEEIRRRTDEVGLLVITPPFIASLPKEPVGRVHIPRKNPR